MLLGTSTYYAVQLMATDQINFFCSCDIFRFILITKCQLLFKPDLRSKNKTNVLPICSLHKKPVQFTVTI